MDGSASSLLPVGTSENPPGTRYQTHTLPSARYRSVLEVVFLLDALLSLSLWITGGHTKYFVDSVIDFHFDQSVFDLALLSGIKIFIVYVTLSYLEKVTLKSLNYPYNETIGKSKRRLHYTLITVTFLTLAYVSAKGIVVLLAVKKDASYRVMHLPYNILLVSSAAFSSLEFVMALYSFAAMKKLRVMRVKHCFNDDFQELNEDGTAKSRGTNLRRVFGLAKPETSLILFSCVCLIGSSGAQIAAPFFFGLVVDAAQKSMSELNHTIVILLIIYACGSVCSSLRSWLFTLAGQRLVARLRSNLFNCIIKQEIGFFDITRTGELTNRLSSDTQVVQNAVTVNISMLLRYMLQILGSLALMFVLNPALTGVLLAVVPVVTIGAVQYGRFVKRMYQQFQDRLADASTTAEESLASIRTVRSFVGEPKASRLYGSDIEKSYNVGKRLAFAQGAFDGSVGLLSYGAVSLVLWYGGKLLNEKVITPGLLTSFLLYTLQVALAFGLLSSLYGDFMKAVGASTRIFELLDRSPTIPLTGGKSLTSIDGGIEFINVSFTYPSRPETPVLKEVSFTMKPGEMVALVGPSGGGKSTIVSLIERFYDPQSGTIFLGGNNIKELNPEWFRKNIAMVSQEPSLFACSIRDNITYGKQASMAEVQEIAKQANAHEFIAHFEDGYDTTVGEKGIRLSGGQKQRVAIARALIMNPRILLLDEATSALDAESEHLVQEAIDRAMVDRTVLVIAHRLSTVRNAHKVLVIDKGRLVEEGTHEELLAHGGVYKKLVLRQLMAGADHKGLGFENSTDSFNGYAASTEFPPLQPENAVKSDTEEWLQATQDTNSKSNDESNVKR